MWWALAVLVLVGQTTATVVPLINGDFEDPVVAENEYDRGCTGWFNTHAPPSSSDFCMVNRFPSVAYDIPMPDGAQVAIIHQGSGASFYQDTGRPMAYGEVYSLSAWLGVRKDEGSGYYIEYYVQLARADNHGVLAQTWSYLDASMRDTFQQSTVTFKVTDPTLIGVNIEVKFEIACCEWQYSIDKVSLDVDTSGAAVCSPACDPSARCFPPGPGYAPMCVPAAPAIQSPHYYPPYAYGVPAMVASQASEPYPWAAAAQAIDQNPNSNFGAGSCTHTAGGVADWFQLDFIRAQAVSGMSIVNRQDCCSFRLSEVGVYVSDDPTPGSGALCARIETDPGALATVTCSSVLIGRYLTIVKDATAVEPILNFCEVYVELSALPGLCNSPPVSPFMTGAPLQSVTTTGLWVGDQIGTACAHACTPACGPTATCQYTWGYKPYCVPNAESPTLANGYGTYSPPTVYSPVAAQSSTYIWPASKILDGCWDSLLSARNCCSHTANTYPLWVRLDLGVTQLVKSITVENRGDDSEFRMQNLTLVVGNVDDYGDPANTVCGGIGMPGNIPLGGLATLSCASPAQGRYVFLYKLEPQYEQLHICEAYVELGGFAIPGTCTGVFCGAPVQTYDSTGMVSSFAGIACNASCDSPSPSPSVTVTPSRTPSTSSSTSLSVTVTRTPTPTPLSWSLTPSVSRSATATPSVTRSVSATPSLTRSTSLSSYPSLSRSPGTPSGTPSASPSIVPASVSPTQAVAPLGLLTKLATDALIPIILVPMVCLLSIIILLLVLWRRRQQRRTSHKAASVESGSLESDNMSVATAATMRSLTAAVSGATAQSDLDVSAVSSEAFSSDNGTTMAFDENALLKTPEVLFISYGRSDATLAFARKLKRDLQLRGFTVWMDENDIHSGANFMEKIGLAVEGCCAMIALIDKKFTRSKFCKDELHLARIENKALFPCFLEDVKLPADMKYTLATVNWTRFDEDWYDDALGKLVLGLDDESIPRRWDHDSHQYLSLERREAIVTILALRRRTKYGRFVYRTVLRKFDRDAVELLCYFIGGGTRK